MATLASLVVKVGADVSNYQKNISQAQKTAQNVAAGFQRIGKTMSIAVTAPLVAAGTAAIKFASDAEEIQSKFNVVFGNMADEANRWAEEFGASVGRARTDVKTWMATLQDTFVPLGYARDEAAKMSKTLTQLAVDVASFNNAADADVIRDFQSAIVGNHETVRKYGIIITEAALKNEAYASGIAKVGEELTEQQKVQARMQLILKGTTDAQGDAIRTADSFANQMKALQGEVKNLAEDIGKTLIPYAAQLIGMLRSAVSWFNNLNPTVQKAIVIVGGLAAAAGPVLLAIGSFIKLIPTLIAGVKGIGAAFAWLSANPIGAVITAMGLAMVATKLLMDNWDKIKPKILAIWEVIAAGAENMAIKIGTVWNNLKQTVYGVIDSILDSVAPLLEWLPGKLGDSFENMRATVKQKLQDVETNLNSLAARGVENQRIMEEALQGVQAAFESVSAQSKASVANFRMLESQQQSVIKTSNTTADAFKNLAGASNGVAQAVKQQTDVLDILDFKLQRLDNEWAIYQASNKAAMDSTAALAKEKEILQKKLEIVRNQVKLLTERYEAAKVATGEYAEDTMRLALALDQAIIKEKELAAAIADKNRVQKTEATKLLESKKRSDVLLGASLIYLQQQMEKKGTITSEDLAKIPKFAEGGIVTRPTLAMIGERGPEAVVPLNAVGKGGVYITITGNNISSDYDIERLGEQLVRVLRRKGVL